MCARRRLGLLAAAALALGLGCASDPPGSAPAGARADAPTGTPPGASAAVPPEAPPEREVLAEAPPTFLLVPADPELSAFMQRNPRWPDPDGAFDRLFALDLEALEARTREGREPWPHVRSVLVAFWANVLHAHPELVMPFARRVAERPRGATTALAVEVVAYGAPARRTRALNLIGDALALNPADRRALADARPHPYAELEARHPRDLDVLWASYFGSGDLDFVRAIARTLADARPRDEATARMEALARREPRPGSPEHDALRRLVTAHLAVLGLRENAAVDPGVARVLGELVAEGGHRGEVAASLLAGLP